MNASGLLGAALALGLTLYPQPIQANAAQGPSPLDRAIKTVVLTEGAWSFAGGNAWTSSARSFSPPFSGVTGLVSARLLYGVPWTVTLGAVMAGTDALFGTTWIRTAHYDAEWLVGLGVPSTCDAWRSGCGLGLGTWSRLMARSRARDVWFSVEGGWVQGRVASDDRRTALEATWLLSPLLVSQRFGLSSHQSPSLLLGMGPFVGMHNLHIHPRDNADFSVPWHETYNLHVGAGPGLKAELVLPLGALADSLEGSEVSAGALLAWLPGHQASSVPAEAGPIELSLGGGIPTGRRVTAGFRVPLRTPGLASFGLSVWGMEVSGREPFQLGHRGIMMTARATLEQAQP